MNIDTNFLWIIGLILSVLMGITGFFFRNLVVKLDEGNRTLMHIDKTLAVYAVKLESHEKRINSLERDNEKNTIELVSMRHQLIGIKNLEEFRDFIINQHDNNKK